MIVSRAFGETAANAGGVRVKFKVNPAAEPHDVKWYDYSQQLLRTFHFPYDKPQHGNVVAIDLETREMEILTEDTKVAIDYPNDSYANLKILKDLIEANRFYYHESDDYRYVWYPAENMIVFIEPGMAGTVMGYVKAKGISIGEKELEWLYEGEVE